MNATVLEKLQETMLELLDETVRICEAHGLAYFLIGGTLLGAVRHKGFIPWDDDLDIVMPRADYERFTDLCATELDGRYLFQTYRNDPEHEKLFGKMRKKNTLYIGKRGYDGNPSKRGIYIDVFPLDDAKNQEGRFQVRQKRMVARLESMIQINNGRWPAGRLRTAFSGRFQNPSLRGGQQRIMQWENEKNYQCFVNFGSQYNVNKQTIPKDRYFPAVKVEFEGRKLNGLYDSEYFLKRIFGDYMKCPPVEERVCQHVLRLSFDLSGPDEVLD
jgi:lipopolysaccharide cholinephosphotransferase